MQCAYTAVPPDVPVNFAQKGPDGRTNANTKVSSRDKSVLKLMHWQNYTFPATGKVGVVISTN